METFQVLELQDDDGNPSGQYRYTRRTGSTDPVGLCTHRHASIEEAENCPDAKLVLEANFPQPKQDSSIRHLTARAHQNARDKGWHNLTPPEGTLIALMHSELSEALEALRHPDRLDDHLPHLDPVGVELADVVIRIFDYCGRHGIDLEKCVLEKMAYNEGRSHKHGGKEF